MPPHLGDGHEHDGTETDDLGLSLRPQIDMARVSCLNEDRPNSGRNVLKLHEDRLSATPCLTSNEDDPELLLYIPFTEAVSIHKLSIRSVMQTTLTAAFPTAPPRTVKLFANRDDLDFDTAHDMQAHCELQLLSPDHYFEGTLDYPLRPAGRFQNVSSLTIFFFDNYAPRVRVREEVSTVVTYVGLKGKGSRQKRAAVETVYESRGMTKDHKVKGEFGNQQFL